MEDKKAKILVVDDEPDIVNVLKQFLSVKGYNVIGAFSGEEALSILEKEKADLVLLDVMMPGLKGTEVARIIKEQYPQMKLIVVTGHSLEAESLSKEQLLDGVFIKPVHMQELYNKLVETLHQKEMLITDLKSKQGIKARVLLIKAKLLFIESSQEVYEFLNNHFKELSHKGEAYEVDLATDEEKIMAKLSLFNPDILIANASFLKSCDTDILSKISEKNSHSREIIVYNIKDIKNMQDTELERLTKAVETTCLKHGLIEIKWIEI